MCDTSNVFFSFFKTLILWWSFLLKILNFLYAKWNELGLWQKASRLKQGSETNGCRPRRYIHSQTFQKCSPPGPCVFFGQYMGRLVWSQNTHHLNLAWWGGTVVFLWGRLRYKLNDRSSWGRNKLRSEAPCFLVLLAAFPDRQGCLIFVPEWCVSVLPNVSESFQAGPLFPTGFGREHDRQVAVPCCVLILQDDFPTLCDTNAYEHLRKNLRKNAGEIYLFNESITCRTKRADNFLHFDSLTSMINCYYSTI